MKNTINEKTLSSLQSDVQGAWGFVRDNKEDLISLGLDATRIQKTIEQLDSAEAHLNGLREDLKYGNKTK